MNFWYLRAGQLGTLRACEKCATPQLCSILTETLVHICFGALRTAAGALLMVILWGHLPQSIGQQLAKRLRGEHWRR